MFASTMTDAATLIGAIALLLPALGSFFVLVRGALRLERKVDAVHDEVVIVGDEVRTSNNLTLGQKSDADESRRIEAKAESDRTATEAAHLEELPDPDRPAK